MTAEEIDYLSVEDLLETAAGVIDHVVVRDAGLLAAAAARPRVTVFGEDAYPACEDKVAALLSLSEIFPIELAENLKAPVTEAAQILWTQGARQAALQVVT